MNLKRESLGVLDLFSECSFAKISRGNEVAHEIAKFYLNNRAEGLLAGDVPTCVFNFLMNNCNTLC